MLIGIKDIDLLILDKFSDREILIFQFINRYIYKLCNDEIFWRTRCVKNYGKYSLKYKCYDTTWKNYYLKISKLK